MSSEGEFWTTVAVVARDRTDIESLLRPAGVRVDGYDDAESFLLHGSARGLAFVIIDIALPGMSGLELLRRLRGAGHRVPVIVVAAEADVPTAVSAMRAGATDFVERPLTAWAVLRRVETLLHGRSGGGVRPS
jgi:two-component system CheB/CheR fusion protein